MSFYEFRGKLSTQMMAYDPRSNKYRGDQYMRKYTKQNKNKRTYEKKDSDTDME